MFEGLGHKVIHMNGMNKGLYHTSMVCASNLMISLLNMSVNMLEICDINESDAYSILKSLTLGNVSNAFEKGCAQALSGPVERADIDTIRKHIEVLEHFKNQENHQNTSDGNGSVVIKCEPGEEKQQDIKDMDMVYRILSQKLIAVASKKNPDMDYSKLKDYLSSL